MQIVGVKPNLKKRSYIVGITNLRCDVTCENCGAGEECDNIDEGVKFSSQVSVIEQSFIDNNDWGRDEDGELLCQECYEETPKYKHENNETEDSGAYKGCDCDHCGDKRAEYEEESEEEKSESEEVSEPVKHPVTVGMLLETMAKLKAMGFKAKFIPHYEAKSRTYTGPALATEYMVSQLTIAEASDGDISYVNKINVYWDLNYDMPDLGEGRAWVYFPQ